jgi:hypothetical protein
VLPPPAYGAAFQLIQQDGSQRGSSQAYQLLKINKAGQLAHPPPGIPQWSGAQ